MSQLNRITGSDSTPVYRVRKIGPADLKDAWLKDLPISRRNLRTSFFFSMLSSGSGLLSARGSLHRDCQTCSAV